MVYFRTKIPNLGTFWRSVECKMLVNFTPIWYIVRKFGILLENWYVYCKTIWHSVRPISIHILWPFGIFSPRFGML
jgi:hypothetical protein